MDNFIRLTVNQFKRIRTDNLMLMLSVYPVLLAVVGRYLVPFLRDTFIDKIDLMDHYPPIVVFFLLANPYIYGALAAFLLLDEREENVLIAIRVTPLTLKKYLVSKITLYVLLSVVSGMIIVEVIDLMAFTFIESLLINMILSLAAPFNMLLINSIAKNRVEGFAVVKGTGLMILIPAVAFYVTNGFNILFGVIPGYWPAMGIYKIANPSMGGLPLWTYLAIGFCYMVIVMQLLYRRFMKSLSS